MNRASLRLALHHLEAIVAVAATGNLSRAAEQLHVTPSAVHHRIGDAERRLGVSLFRKSGRRLAPSPAGEMIARNGRRLLHELHSLETDVERLRSEPQQVIRLAMAFYSSFGWFADFHAGWSVRHPGVDIQVVADRRRHAEAHLLDGEVDLCLFPYCPAHPELDATPLFADELVLIVAPGHPLAAREHILPADLSDQLFYTFTRVVVPDHEYERFLRPGNVRPKRWIDMELPELIAAVVARGSGVSILSRWSVGTWLDSGALVARRVGAAGLPITWHAVRLGRDRQDHMDELIACLQERCMQAIRSEESALDGLPKLS